MPTRGEIFLNSTGSDHAVFDACLIHAHREFLNWTTAKTPDNLPVTADDLRSHIREKLTAHLKTIPELPGQDYGVRRPLIDNLAFLFTHESAIEFHGQRKPFETVQKSIENNLRLTVESKAIPLVTANNPLIQHGMTKYHDAEIDEGGVRRITKIPFHPIKDNDRKVLEYLAMPGKPAAAKKERLAAFLRSSCPYLTEIDDGQIEVRLLGLRQKLEDVIGGTPFLNNPMRERLLETIMDDWVTEFSGGDKGADLFTYVEEEVAEETKDDADGAVKNVFNLSQEEVLDLCFRRLLAAPELDADTKQKLIRRRPVMENLLNEAAKSKDTVFLRTVGKVYEMYFQKLGLPFGQLGHLSLAVASQDSRYDADMYRNILL